MPLTLQGDADPGAERLALLCEAIPDVRLVLDHKKPLSDQSPSGWDLSLANYGVQGGWANQEIVDLLIYHRRQYGYDLQLHREDKYQRTIATAREDAPPMKDHVKTAPLGELLGLGIKRILKIRTPGDPSPPSYRIVSDHGTLELRDSTYLTSNTKFRNACFDELEMFPKPMRGEVWQAFVERLPSFMELVTPGHPDHPHTTEETLETQEWVDAYLRLEHAPNIDETDTSRKPFTDDRVPHIILRHFEMWLGDEFKGAPSRKAIQSRLRDIGWEHYRKRGTTVNLWAWRPIAQRAA